jgi:hypothetical protein
MTEDSSTNCNAKLYHCEEDSCLVHLKHSKYDKHPKNILFNLDMLCDLHESKDSLNLHTMAAPSVPPQPKRFNLNCTLRNFYDYAHKNKDLAQLFVHGHKEITHKSDDYKH